MFLKPGPQNANEFTLVAPTGFEPVFGRGHVFAMCFKMFDTTDYENSHATKTHTGLLPISSVRKLCPVTIYEDREPQKQRQGSICFVVIDA